MNDCKSGNQTESVLRLLFVTISQLLPSSWKGAFIKKREAECGALEQRGCMWHAGRAQLQGDQSQELFVASAVPVSTADYGKSLSPRLCNFIQASCHVLVESD